MPIASRRLRGVSASVTIALLLASCGESTVSQCNRFAVVVNKAQGFMPEFERNIQTFSAEAAQVKSLSDIKGAANQYVAAVNDVVTDLEGLTVELESLELSDEGLITYRDRYIEMVQGFGEALDQASAAMEIVQDVQAEADLPGKIEESQQQTVQAVQRIQELSVQESSIISEVNSYCGAEGAEPESPADAEPPAEPEATTEE